MKRLFTLVPLRVLGGYNVTGEPLERPEMYSVLKTRFSFVVKDNTSYLIGFRLLRKA